VFGVHGLHDLRIGRPNEGLEPRVKEGDVLEAEDERAAVRRLVQPQRRLLLSLGALGEQAHGQRLDVVVTVARRRLVEV